MNERCQYHHYHHCTSPSYTHSSQHQAAAASWPQSVVRSGGVAGTAQYSSTRTRPAPATQQTPPHSHSSAGLQSSALVTRRAILSYKHFDYRLLRMKYNVNKDLFIGLLSHPKTIPLFKELIKFKSLNIYRVIQ